jgi:hypothetical protein
MKVELFFETDLKGGLKKSGNGQPDPDFSSGSRQVKIGYQKK